jgi:quercetin dioxygenase-like cupin family protein
MAIFTDSVDHLVSELHELQQVVHRTDDSSLIGLRIEAGAAAGIEPADTDRYVFVTTGTAWAEIGQEDHRLGTGEVLVAPSGTTLRIRAQGEVPVGLVVVVAGSTSTPQSLAAWGALQAAPGDLLVIPAGGIGEPERAGEIVKVGPEGHAPFSVLWSDDGHLSVFFPGSGAKVHHRADDHS